MPIEYTFTTETGWRVHESRPFSISYAVMQTPGLCPYSHDSYRQERPDSTPINSLYTCRPYGLSDDTILSSIEQSAASLPALREQEKPEDLLATLNRDKLKFDSLSWEIIRQMVEERVHLRDKHRKDIMGLITDVSGDVSCCYNLKTPDSLRQKAALEKTMLDLDRQAREEDLALWKDLTDLRKELLVNQRQYQSTRMRQDLVNNISPHDGDKEETHTMGTGYMPGA
jgi:hypothetical protein